MDKKPNIKLNGAARELYQNRTYTEIFQNVMWDLERTYPFFADTHARHRRNVNFYAGYQWNSQELYAHARQFRIPYVWNKIGQQVNNILGTQLQTKLDVTAAPVEVGDDATASLVNKLIKWSEQINDIDRIEHEVFKSGLLGGIGVTQTRWDFSEFYGGYPIVERLPSYQIGWDLNSAEIDLSDAQFMYRVIPMTRGQALEEYPEFVEAINRADRTYSHAYYVMKQAFTPLQQAYSETVGLSQRARDLIYVIPYFERVRQMRYVVFDLIGQSEPMTFDDRKESERYYDGMIEVYTQAGEALIDEKGLDNVFIAEVKRDCFLEHLTIGNECVSSQMTELANFPWQVFFANHVDGDFWAPVDTMISPQRFMNRMVSEWDLQIGRSNKQLATVIEDKLGKGWDFNKFVTARSQTGASVPVRQHEAVMLHPNQPAHPDIPKVLTMSQNFLLELAGGANALGLQENAAESSKTVKARQAAAGLAKMPLYNNLIRWRSQVAEDSLWYMKQFLDDTQTLRILGVNGSAEFVPLDPGLLNTIKESRTDLQIQSTVDSDIAREETLSELREFFQAMQGSIPGEVVLPIMIELSPNIPKEIKERILSQIQFYQQWQQQQQQAATQATLQERAQHQVDTEMMRDKMRLDLQNQFPGNPAVQNLNGA